MDMEEANAATAQGDLADVVTRANAMAAVASTYHHQLPPAPAAAAAAHMPPHYPSQIMIPCEEERRPMSIMCGDAVMIEAPSTVDPYLSSATALRAGYGLQHQQLTVQISQHACCGRDVLMGGTAPADDVDDAMRISPLTPAAHHQMIKRKNEVKKVVCIPAPPAMSGRVGGGEVIPSDLWAWRKYGQKPIKGSPYPRGYYRCSSSKGCMARKQVERSRSDPNMLVITYTAEHNHPWPMQRNVLAGYARAHTHAPTKNKQHKIDRTDITSSSSSNNIHKYSASEQNAVGGELDGLAAAGNGVSTFDALGSGEGGVMYEACNGIQPDEVFAELEELEPANSMNINANIYSRGVSYDQWHNKCGNEGDLSAAHFRHGLNLHRCRFQSGEARCLQAIGYSGKRFQNATRNARRIRAAIGSKSSTRLGWSDYSATIWPSFISSDGAGFLLPHEAHTCYRVARSGQHDRPLNGTQREKKRRSIGLNEAKGKEKEKVGVVFGWGTPTRRQQGEAEYQRRRRLPGTTTNLVEGRGGDEGDRQGALRGRQVHRRRHPRRLRRRRPPPQGLRHRRRLRQRPLPQGPHPHPREARRIPSRPQATQPRCALPVHELGSRARQACQPHLHPLHHPRSGPRPRRAAQQPRPRLHRHLRSGQQGQCRSHARLRRLPRQVHLRPRRRPPHHRGALLGHSQQRLGVRRHQDVRWRGCSQGHLPRLQQAAGPRVEQGFQDWWIL